MLPRAILSIKRKARRTADGIVAAFKSQVATAPPKYQRQTYQHCIEDCSMGGVAYHLHEMQQTEVLKFKAAFEYVDCALIVVGLQ